ncbi:MAG: Sporulation inhibitor [Paenibacillaceae bacterium]|jgi:transcriptional regulator CtsR|nr:Sporulation inhibitor [Paenibacillaceae bacterium]
MRLLSNELLIESYLRALELQLDKDFIDMLRTEIQERKIVVPSSHPKAKAN